LLPQKSSDPVGGRFRKPAPNLYTVMLAIALLALVLSIIYLYAEQATYEFKMKGGPTVFVHPSRPMVAALHTEQTAAVGPRNLRVCLHQEL